MGRPRFINDRDAAQIGRIALLEEESAAQREELTTAREQIAHQDNRIRFLEERLAQLTRPRELLTEKEAAEIVRVHVETLKDWRKEHPTPRIPFIKLEGGDVRYRAEEIERYLKSRERGSKPALKAA